MDNDLQALEVKRPVAPVLPQVRANVTKGVLSEACENEDFSSASEKKISSSLISTQNNFSDKTSDKMSAVTQVSVQLKERISLKNVSGVNGLINGLGNSLDTSHNDSDSKSNDCNLILDSTDASEHHRNVKENDCGSTADSSSPCEQCEKNCDNSETHSVENCEVSSNCVHSVAPTSTCKDSPSLESSKYEQTDVKSAVTQHEEKDDSGEIKYVSYESELQMPDIMRLIQKDLSEPYSIYTYRYFIHNWPKLCFLAINGNECVGAIVCKLDVHRRVVRRGYIAMLAVDEKYRKRKIGSNLVLKAIRAMVADDADEVVLETEITNKPALRLYENLGFVRDKRLFRYYLNGVDALRLKLWLK
ncbi:N-alpha-acetyltransferase 30A-like [Ischnura elegans]|uniref:N-alpha-acetyltransferase 30A-like n=1 Tax=Ischnura elegans TaxID=197161 RepID=UPI001ED86B56|nr:N-alpha-acetyltransferase 30A-like [Ischnura elegans]